MMADETTPENPQAANAAEATAKPEAPDATAIAAENAELKDKLLRTLAEMENVRRRSEREIADNKTYAIASFARDMLTVGDNLRRAIDAVPKEQRDGRDPALNALIEGVEMTERGMEQSMSKFGVRRVETAGVKFDPQVHQAMFEVEAPDAQPGTVVQEIQAGYAIGERVLRPALVGIAKRPKPAVVTTGESDESRDKIAAAPEGPES
jgi:molecular chaperone GrpE